MASNFLAVADSKSDRWLPRLVKTRSGVEINPHADQWIFRDEIKSININFSLIPDVSPDFFWALKSVLIWYAENRSTGSLSSMFDLLKHFLRSLHVQDAPSRSIISLTDLINYRSLLDQQGMPGRLSQIKGLFLKWHALNLPGITGDAIIFLSEVRLAGPIKGTAVLTMDPKTGPFTDMELQGIQSSLNNAYAAHKVSLEGYLLAWLFMLLGQRPAQYAALKVCDVVTGETKDGALVHVLRMPRVKKRDQLSRATFVDRVLAPHVGELLATYAEQIKLAFADLLCDPARAPLFPQKGNGRAKVAPDDFTHHRTSVDLSQILTRTLKKLNVRSERTGKAIHTMPIRFRRTIGTRAAAEGHGELVIAELLDHEDTQNVGVYVQSTPQIIERIDRAVAVAMAPMAQAFAGVLIVDESHAVRWHDSTSRIVDPRFDTSMKPMGNCGQHGFCGFMTPIACYTCRNFQAWLDGPHKAVLEYLLAERERLKLNTDMRIASINDRTILAVADVIGRCDAYRISNKNADHD